MSDISLTASCNCGRLHLRLDGAPKFAYLCHCLSCRKDSGGLFTAQLKYPTSSVTWVRGKDVVKRWYGRPVQHDEDDPIAAPVRKDEKGDIQASNGWCAVCGAQVLCEMEDGIVIRLGAVDVEDDPNALELVQGMMPGSAGEGGKEKEKFWPKYEFYCMRKVAWAKDWKIQGASQFDKLPA